MSSSASWVASAHFDFEYTLPPHVFARYRDLLEASFTEFAKQWKITFPQEKLKVCFYPDEDDWRELIWLRSCQIVRRAIRGLGSAAA